MIRCRVCGNAIILLGHDQLEDGNTLSVWAHKDERLDADHEAILGSIAWPPSAGTSRA